MKQAMKIDYELLEQYIKLHKELEGIAYSQIADIMLRKVLSVETKKVDSELKG